LLSESSWDVAAVNAQRLALLFGTPATCPLAQADRRFHARRALHAVDSRPARRATSCAPAKRATNGRGLVATGSPFPGTSQRNNLYVFPGVGLGVLAAGAPQVTDRIFAVAARAVAMQCSAGALTRGLLLPPIGQIRRVSHVVARVVAQEAGFDGPIEHWEPEYLPYRATA
jgi:hypothetical protein